MVTIIKIKIYLKYNVVWFIDFKYFRWYKVFQSINQLTDNWTVDFLYTGIKINLQGINILTKFL